MLSPARAIPVSARRTPRATGPSDIGSVFTRPSSCIRRSGRAAAVNPRPLRENRRVPAIEVLEADITKLEVDAIANAANTELRHGGGVAAAISRAGGPEIQTQSDRAAPIGIGEAVATGAGELPCRWVIHAATMQIGGPTSADVIRRATASALAEAERLGARSLALVAFGTGVGGFPLAEAARIEVEEVRRHLKHGSELERIVFAVRGADAREAFEAAVKQA